MFKDNIANIMKNVDCRVINNLPNGQNINKDCGSTKINNVLNYIKENEIDLGIAFDGDGDRVIMCLQNGFIVDGDQIVCILNRDLNIKNNKRSNIVGTIMSNCGLENFQKQHNAQLIRTDVGDMHVKNAMNEYDINIGGEQSGHIICKPYFNNGDGFLCSMLIVGLYLETDTEINEFFFGFQPVKQYLFAVKYNPSLYDASHLCDVLYNKYAVYGEDGRINVRKSGTESVIRIMIESNTVSLNEVANEINNEKYY
jgi:phosphoglucosamine mutase